MKRMQSPSSINTYRQCPRKYFFVYNLKLPTKPSIHLIRGSVAHTALEDFFSLMPELMGEDYKTELQKFLLTLLEKSWKDADFSTLGMPQEELEGFYKETQMMILNWLNQFNSKLSALTCHGISFPSAFEKLKPKTEIEYRDEELDVRGFIDAIEEVDGKIRLMDYKTSKKGEISSDYRLQLAIYALLYQKKHGKSPDQVGIYFLRHGEQIIDVDDSLILDAKFQIEQIHQETTDKNTIGEYPQKQSPLCKWGSGQCDFYEYCFEGKEVPPKKV